MLPGTPHSDSPDNVMNSCSKPQVVWVIEGLHQLLTAATRAFSNFSESGEPAELNDASMAVRQLRNVVKFSRLHGAEMLLDELDKVVQRLQDKKILDQRGTLIVLTSGLKALEKHLDMLVSGGLDIPLHLMPQINELRAARDASLPSETVIFIPRLDEILLLDLCEPVPGDDSLIDYLNQQRGEFHRCLLECYRGEAAHGFAELAEFFLQAADKASAPVQRLFLPASVLANHLSGQPSGTALASRLVVAKIDGLIRTILRHGEDEVRANYPIGLLRNLLYYVAQIDDESLMHLGSLKQEYGLDEGLVALHQDKSDNAQAISAELDAISDAMSREIASTMKRLSYYRRAVNRDKESLHAIRHRIDAVADVTGLLGFGELQESMVAVQQPLDDSVTRRIADAPLQACEQLLLQTGDDLLQLSQESENSGLFATLLGKDLHGDELMQRRQAAEEAGELVEQIERSLKAYHPGSDASDFLNAVIGRLRRTAGLVSSVNDEWLSTRLERFADRLDAGFSRLPESVLTPFAEVLGGIASYIELLPYACDTSVKVSAFIDETMYRLEPELEVLSLRVSSQLPEESVASDASVDALLEEALEESEISQEESKESVAIIVEELPVVEEQGSEAAWDQKGDPDPELLETFRAEASELLEQIETLFANLPEERLNAEMVQQFRRYLHTMKGSSRLVEQEQIGHLSHAVESMLINAESQSALGQEQVYKLAREAVDLLTTQVESLTSEAVPSAAEFSTSLQELDITDLSSSPDEGEADKQVVQETSIQEEAADDQESIEETVESEAPEEEIEAEVAKEGEAEEEIEEDVTEEDEAEEDAWEEIPEEDEVEEEVGEEITEEDEVDEVTGEEIPEEDEVDEEVEGIAIEEGFDDEFIGIPPAVSHTSRAVDESAERSIRVPLKLLDDMSSGFAELMAFGSRLQEQKNRVSSDLTELGRTVMRLGEQLRRMENETESHILNQNEPVPSTTDENFDPLELDRFTSIHEVSRALAETRHDLSSIKKSIDIVQQESGHLLSRHTDLSTNLYHQLIDSRTLAFETQVPRLQRLVRQVSSDLDKKARLTVSGQQLQIDRNMLERIMPLLEHLVRNALFHGIEMPRQREEAGKRKNGKLTLDIHRHGMEVILGFSDDGRGFDREKIAVHGHELGLVESKSSLSDEEMTRIITTPGFSTSEEVDQVSGRGVGLDVVASGIDALGGRLRIAESVDGGARFVIHLPCNRAIMDALILKLDNACYAIPDSMIEAVVRVDSSEVEACMKGRMPGIDYNGQTYPLRRFDHLLASETSYVIDEKRKWLPLVLLRGESPVALFAGDLYGNRQIVIRSVGVQLESVPWINGGTVLASGEVALIVDPGVLLDAFDPDAIVPPDAIVSESERGRGVILAVDDSVTMRKFVTSMLERKEYQVITANDGLDALTKLKRTRPDLVLVDIEMPRMDGFEFTRHLRASPETEELPVIMITSRSGGKHRQQANELGVDAFLVKPYKEKELMEKLDELLHSEEQENE
ncbi:hypothetical protein BOW40_01080 [Solemya velum gill symbiont]|nr:hypothetical protein BOW40_01080 [Solemya velum gill symbiont]